MAEPGRSIRRKSVRTRSWATVAMTNTMKDKIKVREEGASVSLDDLPALKGHYHKAVIQNKEQFDFRGVTLLTSYAKYLIEYFEGIKKN